MYYVCVIILYKNEAPIKLYTCRRTGTYLHSMLIREKLIPFLVNTVCKNTYKQKIIFIKIYKNISLYTSVLKNVRSTVSKVTVTHVQIYYTCRKSIPNRY